MSSRHRHTAAWRLSVLSTMAFAVGTAIAFSAAYFMISRSILNRVDVWLTGEVEAIAQSVSDSSRDRAVQQLKSEVQELEHFVVQLPGKASDEEDETALFFVMLDPAGTIWAEASLGGEDLIHQAVTSTALSGSGPSWFSTPTYEYPVRVMSTVLADGRVLLAGATPSIDLEILEEISELFIQVWAGMVLLGFGVSWMSIRRVLSRIDRMAQAATEITAASLGQRVQDPGHNDEIAHLAATFNAMLERVQVAVEQVRSMAGSLAHDLRSPITTLRGVLESALTTRDETAREEYLVAALSDVDRLANLVDSALDAAEVEAGALHLTREEIDLVELATDIAELFQPAAAERGINIEIRASSPIMIDCDASLLRRLLMNLMDNAVIHLPAGSYATVAIATAHDHAVIEFRDNGPGFPEEVRDHAFDRLVHEGRSPGRGLGLAIVRTIATAHGGTAVLDHPSGGGSRITITLPFGS